MGLLNWLFGRKKTEPSPAPRPAYPVTKTYRAKPVSRRHLRDGRRGIYPVRVNEYNEVCDVYYRGTWAAVDILDEGVLAYVDSYNTVYDDVPALSRDTFSSVVTGDSGTQSSTGASDAAPIVSIDTSFSHPATQPSDNHSSYSAPESSGGHDSGSHDSGGSHSDAGSASCGSSGGDSGGGGSSCGASCGSSCGGGGCGGGGD